MSATLYQLAPGNFHVLVSDIMSSAGCGSGTRFSSELMTNNRLLSLYDCSVHLISFGSVDIDQLTCHTASCRPHPHVFFSCNGTIGVLLSERGPSPLITCCCCFYISFFTCVAASTCLSRSPCTSLPGLLLVASFHSKTYLLQIKS